MDFFVLAVQPGFTICHKIKFIKKNICNSSVAVTCWDGCHNAIGRAKVLYDILNHGGRNTVVFSFAFKQFGSKLWSPLKNENFNYILIPFHERSLYLSILSMFNIKFNTVWICKNRYPSFLLASNISNKDTKYILDIDDNEESFYSSKKFFYDVYTKNISNFITRRIKSKTIASISLKNKYGGIICRHARDYYTPLKVDKKNSKMINMCFIGTVRKHKKIDKIIELITKYNKNARKKVHLTVVGDIDTRTMIKSMFNKNIFLYNNFVTRNQLYSIMSTMDLTITGGYDISNNITKYQISSKIGDSLLLKIPVLVPESDSVSDLKNIDGIYIYNYDNFIENLELILNRDTRPQFPDEFSLHNAYKNFLDAEINASHCNEIETLKQTNIEYIQNKNLLLIWKQFDSSIYGRRVDQVARSYKNYNPSCRVIVLELINRYQLNNIINVSDQFNSDKHLIIDSYNKKKNILNKHGVEYISLLYDSDINKSFMQFCYNNNLHEKNTCVINYPLYPNNKIAHSISLYYNICDIVDNNIFWKHSDTSKYIQEYKLFIKNANVNIFNSRANLLYFKDNYDIIDDKNTYIIENWYYNKKNINKRTNKSHNIIYSGNMNDRIDWNLFNLICEKYSNCTIHIIGTSERSSEKILRLLEYPNVVYHGAMPEDSLIDLLNIIDIAIMPHKHCEISRYMNPLKVEMYKFYNIPIVCTQVEGITRGNNVYISSSYDDFISNINKIFESNNEIREYNSTEQMNKYNRLIDNCFTIITET